MVKSTFDDELGLDHGIEIGVSACREIFELFLGVKAGLVSATEKSAD
jgi:hypothetical protein